MSKFSSKKFVIIDAMALAYKGYYAFISRPLTNSKGEPTSAVFGFINQLFKIIEDTKPDYIAVAFDSKEKTFRHERYEYYKSSRQAMPEDMIPQIHRIKEVIDAFNIPIYILPGYEADDLIGTAVTEAAKLGFDCYAITPDKDYIQLVAENVRVVKPGKSTEEIVILDEDKVREEMGFEPKQMIDYLALVGDSSDDIPGVAGIGPKTAVPLIQEYKSLENIYKNIDKIEKQSLKNKLIENKENAFLSKELATIKIDTPFHMNFEEAIFEKPNFDKLIALFAELDFKSFPAKLKKIFVETVPTATEKKAAEVKPKEEEIPEVVPETVTVFDRTKVKYKLIITSKEAKELAKKLSEAELFVFDRKKLSLLRQILHASPLPFSQQIFQIEFRLMNFVKFSNPFLKVREAKKFARTGNMTLLFSALTELMLRISFSTLCLQVMLLTRIRNMAWMIFRRNILAISQFL
ncbi:MAG: DNA polymerase I [Stygiobacter sp.]|nr:MAG: DNA polymerase I [Stygiobacter sp.]